MSDKPVITVKCLTYNHAPYIRNALDGMLMQRTKYSYEITIHDDASTDGTLDIIKEYEIKYPNLFRIVYEDENQYSKGFTALDELLPKAKGKYIAWCEGDDFWFDPESLSMSVEYLERHPDCIMTVSNGLTYDHSSQSFRLYNKCLEEKDLSVRDIIVETDGGYPTAGMVYRKECEYPIDSFYSDSGISDYTRRLFALAQGGKIHYFNRPTCVYRFRHPGSWNELIYGNFLQTYNHVWELIRLFHDYNLETKGQFRDELMARTWKSVKRLFSMAGTDQLSVWDSLVNEEDRIHDVYDKELRRVFEAVYCGVFFEDWLIEYTKIKQRIYIFGTGLFAGILEKNLSKCNIKYEGFLISNEKSSSEKEFRMMPVKRLRDININSKVNDDIYVLIASKPERWLEITDLLKKEGINRYGHPFMYDFENI